ncbi:MAG: PIN domain-containing protein [Chloroflexi bacterium]|jgi:predicted nucleic acid-binding protein|nr:PIN domain-containing protein [Chloroflexota bacterium]
MIAVFDTNIIIDALNGISQADNEYRRYQRVLISRITWMEVLVGTQDQEEEALVRDFLDTHFEIIPLDLDVAEMAIRLRRLHHMRLPDAIIWATARIHAAELVSRNTKDFNPEWDGIRVPYTL